MEIKHTIEILTKDIQDIEKLVRNLQNSPKPATIDLDLALSKIRNVYEVLHLIKEDNLSAHLESADMGSQSETREVVSKDQPVENVKDVENDVLVENDEDVENDEKVNIPENTDEEINKENEKIVVEEKVISGETRDPQGEKVISEETKDLQEEKILVEEKVDIPDEIHEETEKAKSKPSKEAEILAEKFNSESSLNENLGLKRNDDVTSKLASQPIDSISRNIGINDRFYIVKELFNGQSDIYNSVIRNLDQSSNFNEAFAIIEKRFPDSIEHEGVQILVNLARRRFISSGNV